MDIQSSSEYFNKIRDIIKIEPNVQKLIEKKISRDESLEKVTIANLDSIIKSESKFKQFEIEMWLKHLSLPFNIQVSQDHDGPFIIIERPIKKIEPNSQRITTKSCGVIQFRVPPNTIKKAYKAKQPVAQIYVVTETTFYNGINYIDIAFPVFENFFLHKQRKTIFLCANEDIKKRVEVLASEEIFGPSVEQLKSGGLSAEEAQEFYNELQLFSVPVKEKDGTREARLSDYMISHVFKNNKIKVNDVEIFMKKGHENFIVKENKKTLGVVGLNKWEPVNIEEKFSLKEPGKDAEFGVYFFDPSTGFDPERLTSSFIVWIGNGKGMVVDPLTNLPQYLDRKRIDRNDIEYIFLSHAHSDHDDGILEQILSGKTIKIITTKIVLQSFLNKVQAITGWDLKRINKLINVIELEPGKDFALNEKTSIKVGYGFHSLPTCRFVVTYKDDKNNIEKSISFSGDTLYDKEHVEKLVADGKISQKRADEILGFIWDSDLIIHDAGGGIHTDIKTLSALPENIQKKLIGIHVSELPENCNIQLARKGQEIIFVKADKVEQYRRLARQIDDVVLFKNLDMKQKLEIIETSKKERFTEGQVIIQKGDTVSKFYIIHTGEVEISLPGNKKVYLGKGDYFGEMAFFQEKKTRNATVYAKTDVELISLTEEMFLKYKHQIVGTFQNIIEIRPLLSHISFFRMLLEREINALSVLFLSRRYEKGDFIIKYGEIGDQFYIVKYGLLNVLGHDKDGKKKELNQIGTGDPFGEIALIEDTKRTADVVVQSDYADIISIDRDTFNEIVSEYPGVSLGLEEIKQRYHKITQERMN